ncbi:MAG TPA: response regulator transcription factor [Bryobacteraceae bacterium]|jgi:DNA-binding NarL/FixJ family response regulator
MNKPTILIAEDDFLIRESTLRPLLTSHFEIVAEAADGLEAVAAAEEHRPEIVLLDVSLPVMRGFDAAQKILAQQPGCKLLFVSNYAEREYVEYARTIGASGYVLKTHAMSELIDAIRTALTGQFYWPVFYTPRDCNDPVTEIR